MTASSSSPPTNAESLPPPSPPWAPPPLWRVFLQFATSCSLLLAVAWGLAGFVLRWHGPSLAGVEAVSATEASRTMNPTIERIAAQLSDREVYTFRELVDATATLRGEAAAEDLDRFTTLLIGGVIGLGMLLIGRTAKSWFAERRCSAAVNPLLGIVDADGRLIYLGATRQPLAQRPLSKASTVALRGVTPLSPLARALLECYAATPQWPASATPDPSPHGATTLLQHALSVRARAIDLAATRGIAPVLAELAALGHDLGKLAAYRQEQHGHWTRISSSHDRLGAILLASLPEWSTLTQDEQVDLTAAVSFHHRRDQCLSTVSPRAKQLLALLREADGLATGRESLSAQQPAPSASPPATVSDPTTQPARQPAVHPSGDDLVVRLSDALTATITVLRINTRPFDGRADVDHNLLMLLNHNLRDALTVQLSEEDKLRLGLHTPSDPDDRLCSAHPSNDLIASVLRHLGWLIEQWEGRSGTLWDVTIGRRRWRQVWLLKLDRIPAALRAKWGRSIWPITVLGPSGSDAADSASDQNEVVPPAPGPQSGVPAHATSGHSAITNQNGRVTPGGLMLLALAGLAAWFTMQTPEQRIVLACKPIGLLQRWMQVEENRHDEMAPRMNKAFASLNAHCPDTIGAQASRLAEDARTTVEGTAGKIAAQAKAASHRRIEQIVDGERMVVEGLGETSLVGLRVPPAQERAAISYLRQVALGQRLNVDIAADIDPERRPLISVRSENGELINAQMIRLGLAHPWKRSGP